MTPGPEKQFNEFRIKSDPCELAEVRKRVGEQAQSAGFNEEDAGKIMLAVDEALANVIRHGYEGQCDQPIDLCIEQTEVESERGICITIRDFGKQIDPSKICSRQLDDVRPGGLGVHIMRTVMDDVDFTVAQGGGMLLVMKKRVP